MPTPGNFPVLLLLLSTSLLHVPVSSDLASLVENVAKEAGTATCSAIDSHGPGIDGGCSEPGYTYDTTNNWYCFLLLYPLPKIMV